MRPSQRIAPGGARLARLLLHLQRAGASRLEGAPPLAQTLASAAAGERGGSFWKGLLAHLVLVPSWVTSPALLLLGLLAAGAPLGLKGVASALALGGGLAASRAAPQRGLLCAMVAALAAAAPRGRARALAAAGTVSALAGACSAEFGRRPGLIAFLMRRARDYYRQAELRVVPAAGLRAGRSFFAFHPHGCLSAGWTVNGTFNAEFMRRAGRVTWLIDPNLRHKNPSFKMLCGAYNDEDHAIEAGDAAGFRDLMSRGESVALIPGGFQDAVVFQYRKERTVIRKRKGFIKYCLQYGYRIHPVYTFGESETYYTFTGLERLRNWLSHYNIPMVMFVGWPLCPFLPWPQARILTYVGRGIDMPLLPTATSEEVDHWHSVYMVALRQLFDDNKAEAGYPNAALEIL